MQGAAAAAAADYFSFSLCGKLGGMRDIDCVDFPRHQWMEGWREPGRNIE